MKPIAERVTFLRLALRYAIQDERRDAGLSPLPREDVETMCDLHVGLFRVDAESLKTRVWRRALDLIGIKAKRKALRRWLNGKAHVHA